MKLNLLNSIKRSELDKRFQIARTANFRLLLLALIIGALVGVVGSVFRIGLDYLEEFRIGLQAKANMGSLVHWTILIACSIVAIAVSLILVKKYAPEAGGSGVHEIEGALDEVRPIRWKRVIPIKFIASLFSLGSGLLLGREGPTIQLGANLGKMVKDLSRQRDIEDNSLVSAGAAAGLSVAFNAPFSGIIFVIEEMHEHFKFTFFSVATIMIGASTGSFVSRLMLGAEPEFLLPSYSAPLILDYWMFIVLGIVFGAIGLLFNKVLIKGLDIIQASLKNNILFISVVAGTLVAVLGVINPRLISGGYTLINQVFNENPAFASLLFLFFLRFLLSVFSYILGSPGGIFLPLLTLGVLMGMVLGLVFKELFPTHAIEPAIFAIAGMAAIFAATIRAPLTGLVLAIEMTANHELMLPLILTTVSASVITVLMGNEPIYAILLRKVLMKVKKE